MICNIQEKQQMFINCNSLLCSINSIVFGAGQVMGFFWCCANCLERQKIDGTKNKNERKANDTKINGEKQLRKIKRK